MQKRKKSPRLIDFNESLLDYFKLISMESKNKRVRVIKIKK